MKLNREWNRIVILDGDKEVESFDLWEEQEALNRLDELNTEWEIIYEFLDITREAFPVRRAIALRIPFAKLHTAKNILKRKYKIRDIKEINRRAC